MSTTNTTSETVRKAFPYIVVLHESNRDQKLRKNLLHSKKVLNCLSELIYNILAQNVVLTEGDKKKLKKYKSELIKLARKGGNNQKYTILTGQKGRGIVSTVLSIGLPILASLLAVQSHGSVDRK